MQRYKYKLGHSNFVRIRGHLGAGQFGSVKKGFWKIGKSEFEVALKMLSQESESVSRVRFLQEAAIMAQFRHPNIVSLYGVVSKDEPVSNSYSMLFCRHKN